MSTPNFVHLHAHSDFSILDGIVDPYTLVRTAGHLGQPAIALTDHGRLSGTAPFVDAIAWYNRVHAERHAPSKSCAKNGCHRVEDCKDALRCPKIGTEPGPEAHELLAPIKGILGIETYVAHHGRATREKGDWGHLVLLAANEAGWRNLIELASRASLEGFYSKPRVDRELLERYSEGLIVLSSCLGGHLASLRREAGDEAADELIRWYQSIFGDRYYLELQWHLDQDPEAGGRAAEQWDFNRYLIGAAARTGVSLVMANDLHYATRDAAILEEIVLANQQQMSLAEVSEAKRAGKRVLSFDTPDFYVKSRTEMGAALGNWLRLADKHDPEIAAIIRTSGRSWLDRTVEIADRVTDYQAFHHGLHFPSFPVPDGSTVDEELARRVWAGAALRYPVMTEKTRRLVAYELQCVQELGFAGYFLITEDFCTFARTHGIDVGLGRGSAPGSVVTYALGITSVDPIKYGASEGGIGLTRFLNPTVCYGLRTAAFVDLDPDCLALIPPPVEEMETEIAAALNTKLRVIRTELAAGRDPDSGLVLRAHERKAWDEWIGFMRNALLDEWETIKRFDRANESATPVGSTPHYGRGATVEPLWRCLRHQAAGHPIGDRNEHSSYIAHFLDFTEVPARAPDGQGTALLPDYSFHHSRMSMPDIDVDFTPGYEGRERVMRYVVEKYGEDHVAQIATFGTMLSKSAIKDVARAKGLPPQEADALTLLVPKKFAPTKDDAGEDIPGVTLREMIESAHPAVMEGSRELRVAMAADPKVDEIIRLAARIEGIKRTVSTHACGVLITPGPVTDFVAVEKTDKGTGKQATYDGPTLTDVLGLLKVDFLGLKNLGVNRSCVERIAERHPDIPLIDWQVVPDDDPDAMKLLRDGRTYGIFQFGTPFATGVIKQIKPRKVGDLMVATALGRPGPMEFIPKYVEARAAGHVDYGDPVFAKYAAPVLDSTYGVMVYQEQLMRLAIELSGFTLSQSDGLRKACSKKKLEDLIKYQAQFVEGAVRRGVERIFIEAYWEKILSFASYAFNFSHSMAYGLTGYKQAYLKAKYPSEFMAALMSVDQHEGAKERGAINPLAQAILEAQRMNIATRAVDINASTERIEVEADGGLRMSIAAIKGIGARPVTAILTERKANGSFLSLFDFITRTVEVVREKDPETGRTVPAAVNKTAVVGLLKVGAFDALGNRGALVGLAEAYFGTTSVKKRAEIMSTPAPAPLLAGVPTPREWLEWEHELLGFYISAHPSSSIDQAEVERIRDEAEVAEKRRARNEAKEAKEVGIATVAEALAFERARDPEIRVVAGITSGFSYKANRTGNGGRLIGRIEDATAGCRLIIWAPRETDPRELRDSFATIKADPASLEGAAVVVVGGFSFNATWDKEPGVIADRLSVVGRPAVAAPVAPTISVATRLAVDPTRLEGDQTATSESLDALFG